MTALVPCDQARVSGHFGEYFQGRLGTEGPVVLVTVACSALAATATAQPGAFAVTGVDTPTARRFFDATGAVPNLQFRVTCDAPLGAGAGMSTAALLALAKAAKTTATAKALVAAEGAVDPLMLPNPDAVLWASREARTVQSFDPPPDFAVVGGFFKEPEPTDPQDNSFPDITDLIPHWQHATARKDRAAVAGIATEAARRTTAMRGPSDDPTETLAQDLGALGIIRAHTGSARGLLFNPDIRPARADKALAEAGFQHILHFQTGSAP